MKFFARYVALPMFYGASVMWIAESVAMGECLFESLLFLTPFVLVPLLIYLAHLSYRISRM